MTSSHLFSPVRRSTRICGLAIVGALLVACSGDKAAAPTIPPPISSDTLFATTTTTASTATTVPDTSDPSTTTTTPSTTTAPDPTSSTPSRPTTEATTSPTTAPQPVDPDVQAVIDGLVASWNAFNEVKLDPFNDEKLRPLAETHRDLALDSVVDLIENRRIDNRRSITNESVPSRLEPFAETVEISGDVAVIEYCWIDSNVLVDIAGNEDGTDKVIDDSVTVVHERETFERLDGRWIKTGGETIETAAGASCDVFR